MTVDFNKDDLFVLGSLGARAVVGGQGEHALGILKFVQTEASDNAGGFLMEAVFLHSIGFISEAIDLLEDAKVFDASKNGDEAMAFFIVLLRADGQTKRALDLCNSVLWDGSIQSEATLNSLEQIMEELEEESSAPAPFVIN